MAAEPILEPILEPPVLWVVPDTIPLTDTPIQYPGMGPKALWDDVWGYGKSIVKFFGRHDDGLTYVTSRTLNEAVDSAIGATIKSLSGFINQSAKLAVDAQNWSSMELDAMSSNIGAIYHYFDSHIKLLEASVVQTVQHDIPAIVRELATLRHDMEAGFAFNSAADRQWAVDNNFRPLEEGIFREATRANAAIDASAETVRGYVDHMNALQAVHFAELVAPVAAAVTALQTESEECVKPMCETLGPKTDLGKLLKGLKLATELAALTAILNMDEAQLAALIRSVVARFATVVGDVETFVGTGGETIGELITHATADLL